MNKENIWKESEIALPRTPFSRWSENGENDPHGDLYGADYDENGIISTDELIRSLKECRVNIMILTITKERLRYLSRKLYSLLDNHVRHNIERAEMMYGELTDDELGNEYFIYEHHDYRNAVIDRMEWLVKEIDYYNDSNSTSRRIGMLLDSLSSNTSYLIRCIPEDTNWYVPDISSVDEPKHYKTNTGRGKFKKRSKSNKKRK